MRTDVLDQVTRVNPGIVQGVSGSPTMMNTLLRSRS